MSEINLHPVLRDGVRAVLFDVGGTLIHPDFARLAQLAHETANVKFATRDLSNAFCDLLQEVSARLQKGLPPAPDETRTHWVFLRLYRALGIEDETCERLHPKLEAAHREKHLWCVPDKDAARVLRELKRAGLRCGAISNTEDGRLEEILIDAGLTAYLDLWIDSQLVGVRKPDAAIFNLALERLQLKPEEAVFVGDSYGHDALGAARAGLRPVLLDPFDCQPACEFPRIKSLGELVQS